MKNLSDLYDANFKKIRGKSKQGFIRPTLGEYFMTHQDFSHVTRQPPFMDEVDGFLDEFHYLWNYDSGSVYKNSVNTLLTGKYYLEQEIILIRNATSVGIDIINAENDSLIISVWGSSYVTGHKDYTINVGDIAGIAVDVDSGTVMLYENGNYRRIKAWEEKTPIKLRSRMSSNNSQHISELKSQINAGPDFLFPIPEGYTAFNSIN